MTSMQNCIQACTECHAICLETLQHCLTKGGRHAEAQHITLLQDCAQICAVSADFMLRGSAFHIETCETCAEICEACADSCESIPDDDVMAQCAQACRACAESCESMADMNMEEAPRTAEETGLGGALPS